ncbi:MAG TPA: magnesium transporter CorA family protein [Acidimicrobiia bacterium]|nr:magnesium transporter CorA family protein [Acidimicrobiia bacterium]
MTEQTLQWIDLCDPDEATLRATLPAGIHDLTVIRLLRPAREDHEPRPRMEARGNYVFGVLSFPVVDGECVSQEIDVVATLDRLVTVRKTPVGGRDHIDLAAVRASAERLGATPGLALYMLFDEVAERFLDVVDNFDTTIDDLEDHVTEWESGRIRTQISSTRHDILHVRRLLAPTRDAARAILDDRVELDGEITLFPRDVELHFADAYDKLLRATDGLDLSRDLLAGVRDFHQAEVANDQNEVMKRLTVIASVLLLPTLIVGVYGQNLKGGPEFNWAHGYWWSWGLIVVTTLAQLWYFRRKKWI